MKDIDLSQYKIKIFTRSMNHKLFEISSETTQSLPFERIALKRTSAIGYFYEILKHDIDYAINIDEDAFLTDPDKLIGLLKYCIANDIANCGFPDGGVTLIREYNPIVTNAFFNILNVREINKKLNYREIRDFDFKHYDYEAKIPKHLFKSFSYNLKDKCEPYYPFFLWLNMNYKVLYLDAEQDVQTRITTYLKDMNGDVFLVHSWYSREYLKDPEHTNRINQLYTDVTGKQVRKFDRRSDKWKDLIDVFDFHYQNNMWIVRRVLKKLHIIAWA